MPTLKRYLVFSFAVYYPGGGWTDFDADYETIEEARAHKPSRDCKQIIDTTIRAEVE